VVIIRKVSARLRLNKKSSARPFLNGYNKKTFGKAPS